MQLYSLILSDADAAVPTSVPILGAGKTPKQVIGRTAETRDLARPHPGMYQLQAPLRAASQTAPNATRKPA